MPRSGEHLSNYWFSTENQTREKAGNFSKISFFFPLVKLTIKIKQGGISKKGKKKPKALFPSPVKYKYLIYTSKHNLYMHPYKEKSVPCYWMGFFKAAVCI